jgi:site-specific DNA-methyltransferase (cytosine-N4-specific)
LNVAYHTLQGVSLRGDSEKVLSATSASELRGQFQLIFSSPPFPLNRKKRYDNKQGKEYVEWLSGFAGVLRELLTPDGSIVLEVGNAWEPGRPTMSTLAMESLLEFKAAGKLYLCQEFIWHNPARLPTPAQWVTVERIRVKDSFTRLWWMSPTPRPKADNRQVLVPYSESMKALLKRGKYNAGKRPSGHNVGRTSFLKNHGGAIPANVLSALTLPESVIVGGNTDNDAIYRAYCKRHKLEEHPARMPVQLADFFIRLCTAGDDAILDPFAGSNVTGFAAERLGRRWLSIEARDEYATSGIGRFGLPAAGIVPTKQRAR